MGSDDRLAGSYPFLTMLSVAVCGWLMARQYEAMESYEGDPDFQAMKWAAALFYLDMVTAEARGLRFAACTMAKSLYAASEEAFAA